MRYRNQFPNCDELFVIRHENYFYKLSWGVMPRLTIYKYLVRIVDPQVFKLDRLNFDHDKIRIDYDRSILEKIECVQDESNITLPMRLPQVDYKVDILKTHIHVLKNFYEGPIPLRIPESKLIENELLKLNAIRIRLDEVVPPHLLPGFWRYEAWFLDVDYDFQSSHCAISYRKKIVK